MSESQKQQIFNWAPLVAIMMTGLGMMWQTERANAEIQRELGGIGVQITSIVDVVDAKLQPIARDIERLDRRVAKLEDAKLINQHQ